VAESAATAFEEVRPYVEPKYQAYRQWEQEKALPEGETWSSAFAELAGTASSSATPAACARRSPAIASG
jgi:hypothetical protein